VWNSQPAPAEGGVTKYKNIEVERSGGPSIIRCATAAGLALDRVTETEKLKRIERRLKPQNGIQERRLRFARIERVSG
jgi:hypothetical protein